MKIVSIPHLLLILSLTGGVLVAKELPTVTPEEVGISSEHLQHIDRIINDYLEDEKFAGAVIQMTRGGKTFYHEAFGYADIEDNRKMQKDSIFRIASQTKAITSVSVMILQEQGKLHINEPVGNYLPEFMETTVSEKREDGTYEIVPAKRKITIRDLLTHTAGIGYSNSVVSEIWEEAGIGGWYFADREEPVRETIRRIGSLPMSEHPGEKWVYGYATDILGALVEVVSGMSLDAFFKKYILEPLDMKDTHFYLPLDKVDRLTTVYGNTDEKGLFRAPDGAGMNTQGNYVEGPRVSFSGGAGLLSTTRDYTRFLQMLANGGELHGTRVLSRKSVDLMRVDHIGDLYRPGEGHGLGFRITENLGIHGKLGSVEEYGWGGAYHTTYWIDPAEDLVVSIMMQMRPANSSASEYVRVVLYGAFID